MKTGIVYIDFFNKPEDFERFICNVWLLEEAGKDPMENISRAFEGACVCIETYGRVIYVAITDNGFEPYFDAPEAVNILPEVEDERPVFEVLKELISNAVLRWAREQIEDLEEEDFKEVLEAE